MTHVLRIAHLRIALHVANPEVGNREVHRRSCEIIYCDISIMLYYNQIVKIRLAHRLYTDFQYFLCNFSSGLAANQYF